VNAGQKQGPSGLGTFGPGWERVDLRVGLKLHRRVTGWVRPRERDGLKRVREGSVFGWNGRLRETRRPEAKGLDK